MDIETVAASLVGLLKIDLVQDRMKRAMLKEALQRNGGNFTKAAIVLGVTRQAVQHMVTRFEIRDWAGRLRHTDRHSSPVRGSRTAAHLTRSARTRSAGERGRDLARP